MSDIDKNIATRVKSFRKERGLTQKELAKKLDISQGYLSDIERGETFFSGTKLISLSTIFRLNLWWLLTGEGEMFINQCEKCEIRGIAEALARYGSTNDEQQFQDPHIFSEPSRSVFLINKALSNISQLLRQHPELIKIISDITELFVYLFDKPYEKQIFIEILEGMLNNLREKRLKVIK